jgi:hypothetical protein
MDGSTRAVTYQSLTNLNPLVINLQFNDEKIAGVILEQFTFIGNPGDNTPVPQMNPETGAAILDAEGKQIYTAPYPREFLIVSPDVRGRLNLGGQYTNLLGIVHRNNLGEYHLKNEVDDVVDMDEFARQLSIYITNPKEEEIKFIDPYSILITFYYTKK